MYMCQSPVVDRYISNQSTNQPLRPMYLRWGMVGPLAIVRQVPSADAQPRTPATAGAEGAERGGVHQLERRGDARCLERTLLLLVVVLVVVACWLWRFGVVHRSVYMCGYVNKLQSNITIAYPSTPAVGR